MVYTSHPRTTRNRLKEASKPVNQNHSLERSILFIMHRISVSFAKSMLEDLGPEGLSVAQWRTLSILNSRGSSTIRAIHRLPSRH